MDLIHNLKPPLTQWLVRNRLLETPLILLDAGVYGGIQARWGALHDQLVVHGFDALEESITPLKAENRPNHYYHAVALGNEDGERELSVQVVPQATSFYSQAPSRYDVDKGVAECAGTRRVLIRKLDSLRTQGIVPCPDFIKIDCEGFEPEIIKGAQGMLRDGVLGFEVETSFNLSPILPQTHFWAVYEHLLPHGFLLYDLAFNRISRASFAARAKALNVKPSTLARPATFNVLFYRDTPAANAAEALKRVVILELYGMMDSAYEVLTTHAHLFPPTFPLSTACDLLITSSDSARAAPSPLDSYSGRELLKEALLRFRRRFVPA